MKRNKLNNKGFTLVELLATIALLSLVLTIVVYVALNVVNEAKKESYKVTVSNIEDDANSYVLERTDNDSWVNISNNVQYQCVSVQDLIDTGYFKSDVLDSLVDEGVKLNAGDLIYVERDRNSKAILKNVLLVGEKDSLYGDLCNVGLSIDGKIDFMLEPSDWSKKKTITIEYELYNNGYKVTDFNYNYSFQSNSDSNQFVSTSAVERIEADSNGTVYAEILDKNGNVIVDGSLVVSKIDNVDPVGVINSTNNVAPKQTATLTMTDNVGVVAYYFGKSNPTTTTVTYEHIDGTRKYVTNKEVDSAGTWYLAVEDVAGNKTVVSKTFYKTTLVMENGSVTPSNVLTMSGNSFNVPDGIAIADYEFIGWYNNKNYTGSVITVYKPNKNSTLYGIAKKNEIIYTITYKANGGYGPNADLSKNSQYCKMTEENFDIGGTEMKLQTCEGGKSCKLNTNTYTRQCHKFIGWSISSSASKAEYVDGYEFTKGLTQNITLYAVWKSEHDFSLKGNNLFYGWCSEFTCGHLHAYAYAIYCSKCYMAKAHYKACYYDTDSTLWCPNHKKTIVDDGVVVKNESAYKQPVITIGGVDTKLDVYYNDAIYSWGGTTEGKAKLKSGEIKLDKEILVYEHTHDVCSTLE